MTEEEFKEFIAKSDPEDKLVFIQLKYSWEDKPRYITELYLYDPQGCLPYSEYCWLYDWWEGEDEVKFLGCINVREAVVPLFDGGDSSVFL